VRLVARTHVVQTPLHGGSVRPSSTVQALGMHEDSLEVVDTTVPPCREGSCAAMPGRIPCRHDGWDTVPPCRVGYRAAMPGGIPCRHAGWDTVQRRWEIVLCRMPCGIPRRS
jgi:hypothetical protein